MKRILEQSVYCLLSTLLPDSNDNQHHKFR